MKGILGLICVLVVATTIQGTWIRDRDESSSDESFEGRRTSNKSPFRVVTGPIRDDSSEEVGEGPRSRNPIGHHIDFDELFPGQDQLAVSAEDDRWLVWRPQHPPTPLAPVEIEDDENNDDLVVPDFARMFPQLPRIGAEEESVQDSSRSSHPWWQHWAQLIMTQSREWWKGSNVCIKREESEESSINGGPGTGESATQTLVLNGPTDGDDDNQGPPQFQMQFSACENLDTRYSCQTRLFGARVIKTIKTDYECCNGYSLNSAKTKCERGHYENLTSTISSLGGKEFLRLAHTVAGLGDKLSRENLTVFLPTSEALLSSKLLPPAPIRRRRRNILHHPKNEAGGRNIRRNNANINDNAKSFGAGGVSGFGEMYPIHYDELGGGASGETDNVIDNEGFVNFYVVKKLDTSPEVEEVEEGNNHQLAETLLNHLVSGSLSTDDFVDEKVIYSEGSGSKGKGGGLLRLNTWEVGSEGVKTVNCVRLLSSNHRCTNGMVHLVDGVISPVSQNIHDVLTTRPELSVWSSLMSSLKEMTKLLQDGGQHLTLLAPTNGALDRLGPTLLRKLRSGDSCLKRIVSRHILSYSFCSSIVNKGGEVRTLEHDRLALERSSDDRIFINGSEIIVRDIMTTNGVIQIIDAVLLSENDKPVTEVMEREGGLSSFVQALRRVGLIPEVDALSNVTIFAPTDSAFAALPQEIRNDDEKLRDILRYHVAKPEIRGCHFSHQQLLPTTLANASIRINLYSSFPLGMDVTTTAGCGVIGKSNIVGCGGVVHILDRVLIPPSLDLVSTLKVKANSSNFSIFNRLLSENEELFRSLKSPNAFFTLFVPTDSAFHALSHTRLASILNNKEEAERVLKRHITSDSLCCSGVAPHLYFITKRVASIGDLNVPVYRDVQGQVIYGHGVVTSCDLQASNGIIHTVNKVLVRDESRVQPPRDRGMLMSSIDKDFDVGAYFLRL